MEEKTPSAFAQAFAEFSGAREAFKVAIVAPVHIQPSEAWIGALNVAARTATIIIVDDSDGKVKLPDQWEVYGYEKQREALGDELYEQFKMFHKSAACKQFGVWLAQRRGFDPIIVIDSDCIIPPDFVAKHIEMLLQRGDGWENPIEGTKFYSRGFPMYERKTPIAAHMGLWENELDLYGTDRLNQSYIPKLPPQFDRKLATGIIPLSGMNVSFRNEAAQYMLFLPNFEFAGGKFTRHDDIWGGYIFQRVLKMLGFGVSYGKPIVFHDTVVVPQEDAAEEVMMIRHEREFYDEVDIALGAERPMFSYVQGQRFPSPTDVFDCLVSQFSAIVEAEKVAPAPPGHEFPFAGLIPAFKLAADFYRDDQGRTTREAAAQSGQNDSTGA